MTGTEKFRSLLLLMVYLYSNFSILILNVFQYNKVKSLEILI